MCSKSCPTLVLVAVLVAMLSTIAMSQPADNEPVVQTAAANIDARKPNPAPSGATGGGLQNTCLDSCGPVICCDACSDVYGEVEWLFMQRVPRLGQQPIIEDFNSQDTVISTSDLRFNFDPGLRATLGVRLDNCRALEFTYMGLFEANTSVSATASEESLFKVPDPLGSAEDANVFRGMDRVTVGYSSTLNSFELNLPCCCCCTCCDCDRIYCRSFEWFAGFRYINLGETLDVFAERDEIGGTENGTYGIRTRNNLYGAQIGSRIRRGWNRFRWEATGKAGIFGNDAYQSQYITDYPDFPLRPSISAEHGQVSFVGELNFSLIYKLTNVWGLRGGYNVMWIEGLALAPNQLDFTFTDTSGSGLNTHGGMLLHGVSLGLEGRW
jgi:hypothetical protein